MLKGFFACISIVALAALTACGSGGETTVAKKAPGEINTSAPGLTVMELSQGSAQAGGQAATVAQDAPAFAPSATSRLVAPAFTGASGGDLSIPYQLMPTGVAGITTVGRGRATTQADEARVLLMIGSEQGPKPFPGAPPGPILDELPQVVAALKALGIDENEIKLFNPPEYYYGGPSQISVTVRQLEQVSQVAPAVTQALASTEYRLFGAQTQLIIRNCQALETAARQTAAADAKAKAEGLASLLAVSLGGVVAASDGTGYYYGYDPSGVGLCQGQTPYGYRSMPFDLIETGPMEVVVEALIQTTWAIR